MLGILVFYRGVSRTFFFASLKRGLSALIHPEDFFSLIFFSPLASVEPGKIESFRPTKRGDKLVIY
jgi:hypothetical protein